MTTAKELLAMIEAVDPNDTAKLDEIETKARAANLTTPLFEAMEVIRHQQEAIERLKGALQFYESGFEAYKQHKSLPGFAWRPTESLLDDCGEVAKQTLAAINKHHGVNHADN